MNRDDARCAGKQDAPVCEDCARRVPKGTFWNGWWVNGADEVYDDDGMLCDLFAPKEVPKRVAQYCTFCGRRDDEVQLLIAGYDAMICDHCVQVCNEILTEKGIPLMTQALATDCGEQREKSAAEPPLDCRVGLDITCYRIKYCLSDWEDISAGMGELCAPIGAVRAVNALCDEVERLRGLLATNRSE